MGTRHLLGIPLLAGVLLSGRQGFAQLKEPAMAPPPEPGAYARVVSDTWLEIVLPDASPYDLAHVTETARYSITSTDDPAFATPVNPEKIHHRHWPEQAWYSESPTAENVSQIYVTYRIFLQLAPKLQEGKHYDVALDPGVVTLVEPLPLTFALPNESLHVNQVAYRADGPKLAYLSQWTGQGAVEFSTSAPFALVDEQTLQTVFSGPVQLEATADQEPFSRSNVYSMDFSSFSGSGTFHVYVPGVGRSFPFLISPTAFNTIGYTMIRGLTMQRDGNHGLQDPVVTQWTRPPAHLDDAIDEASGQKVDLVGGHMDAGDRGKYAQNEADVSCSMLAAMRLFPQAVQWLGESLQIPESANGKPDFVDEAVWELDYVAKTALNTSRDGLQPEYLRPASGGYEQGAPPEGQTGRKFFNLTQGPYRARTLYTAGALAMACNTELIKTHFAERLEGYQAGAERLFEAFEAHASDDSFWKPDPGEPTGAPHLWSAEMLIAAANLYELTGEQKYLDWIVKELPADLAETKQWGWVLEGPWLNAFVSLLGVTRPGLSQSVRDQARAAILHWADSIHKPDTYPGKPFGHPLLQYGLTGQIGWYFSPSAIGFPLMLAYGVSGEGKYRDDLIRLWNYVLGGNALSRTFVSGLGQPHRRPRWLVHEISQYQWMQYKANPSQGWSEMVPGILAADLQQGDYEWYYNDAWNAARKNAKFPDTQGTPALYRFSDSWTVRDEFIIPNIARAACSILALVGEPVPEVGPDGGVADASGSSDGSPIPEGGLQETGGVLPADGSAAFTFPADPGSSCGCRTGRGTATAWTFVLTALLGLARRRRRGMSLGA